jgi:hypothetical protein
MYRGTLLTAFPPLRLMTCSTAIVKSRGRNQLKSVRLALGASVASIHRAAEKSSSRKPGFRHP